MCWKSTNLTDARDMKKQSVDRRVFLKQLGYGSSAVMIVPGMLTGCSMNGNGEGDGTVSIAGIMPVAAAIDCSKLLLASGALSEEFTELVTADINRRIPGNISRLGCSIPFETESMKEYISSFRNSFDPSSGSEKMKASLLVGWVIFHPLKKAMSEVYGKLISQGYHYDSITRYYDVFMLQQVSGGPDPEGLDEEEMQEWLHIIPARMITRLHTLKPDYLDGAGWVNRMSDWRKSNLEAMNRYGTLYVDDDKEMFNRLIKRYNVYQPEDRLIQLVRNMKSRKDPEAVHELILSDPGTSIYSQALVSGYQNVLALQDYFGGKTGMEAFNKRL